MLWRRLVQSILPYRLLTLAAAFHAAHAAHLTHLKHLHPPTSSCLPVSPPASSRPSVSARPPLPARPFCSVLLLFQSSTTSSARLDLDVAFSAVVTCTNTPSAPYCFSRLQRLYSTIDNDSIPQPLSSYRLLLLYTETPTSSADFSLLVKDSCPAHHQQKIYPPLRLIRYRTVRALSNQLHLRALINPSP